MKTRRIILTIALLVFVSQTGFAWDRFWLGDGGSIYWSNPDNWIDTNGDVGIPQDGDSVYLVDPSFQSDVVYDISSAPLNLIEIDGGIRFNKGLFDNDIQTYGHLLIGNAGVGIFDHNGATNTVGTDLILGNTATSEGNYYLWSYNWSPAFLKVQGNSIIGNGGAGYFSLNSGIHEIDGDLIIGKESSGNGTYMFTENDPFGADHTLTVSGSTIVGEYGTGIVEHAIGQANLNGGYQIWQAPWDPNWTQSAGLILGKESGSRGTYNLASGNLNVAHATIVGDLGQGQFNLGFFDADSGAYAGDGVHTTGDLYVGYNSDMAALSEYNLYSGIVNVVGGNGLMGFTVIGGKDYGPIGAGVLNQYGGLHATGGLFLSDTQGSTAGYNLFGGNLNVGWAGTSVGGAGVGNFYQSGGIHATQDLLLGVSSTSHGLYELCDNGILSAHNEFIGNEGTGIFNQTGGINYVGFDTGGNSFGEFSELIIGRFASSNGTYNLSGGELYVAREIAGDAGALGSVNQSGNSIHQISQDLIIGQDIGSTGTFLLGDFAQLSVGGNVYLGDEGGSGSFEQSGASSAGFSQDLIIGARSESGDGSSAASSGVYTQSGGVTTVGNFLTLGQLVNTMGIYNLSGDGQLSVNYWELIGESGTGTFNQDGGTHFVQDDLYLGHNPDGFGSYNLTSGDLNVGWEYIGRWGTGVLTQDGGTNTIRHHFNIAAEAGSTGTYYLNNGSLYVGDSSDIFFIDAFVGFLGNGYFYQAGGTHTVGIDPFQNTGNLVIGFQPGSYGEYILGEDQLLLSSKPLSLSMASIAGPVLTVYGNEEIGVGGTGYFEQNNGSIHTVSDSLFLGKSFDTWVNEGTDEEPSWVIEKTYGQGDYVMNGGYLSVGNVLFLGFEGDGTNTASTFTQDGGSVFVATDLNIGQMEGSSGAYALSDKVESAELSVGRNLNVGLDGTGTFQQDGGTVQVGQGLIVGTGATGSGSYFLGRGAVGAGWLHVGVFGPGTFTQQGGDVMVAENVSLGNGSGTGYGTYILQDSPGPATLTTKFLNIGGWGVGKFIQNSGTLTVQNGFIVNSVFDDGTAAGRSTFSLNGGFLDMQGNEIKIGTENAGYFEQNGGVFQYAGALYLGDRSNAYGKYIMTEGTLTGGGLSLGEWGGTGEFFQHGGTVTVNSLQLARQSDPWASHGNYYLHSGNLSTVDSVVGEKGVAVFMQAGGNHSVSNIVNIAHQTGSQGIYELNNPGVLSSNELRVGLSGEGTFKQYGGINTVTQSLWMGGNTSGFGTYLLTDGMLSSAFATIGGAGKGTFIQDGGIYAITEGMKLGEHTTGEGTYTINAGTLHGGKTIMVGDGGKGTLNINGGIVAAGVIHNNDTINLGGSGATVNAAVNNYGTVRATNASVNFYGDFNNYGVIVSDPSVLQFDNLTIAAAGYIQAADGDTYRIAGNFFNTSTQNTLWNTFSSIGGDIFGATLDFSLTGGHTFALAGADLGDTLTGFHNNFAWKSLDLTRVTFLSLEDGNSGNVGAAFYAGVILGLNDYGTGTLGNIYGNGLNMYYLASLPENAYLNSGTYNLVNGGQLIPVRAVPEPLSMFLFGLGGVVMALRRQRK